MKTVVAPARPQAIEESEALAHTVADDQMIEHTDIDDAERILQRPSDDFISLRGLGDS
jgi:hypothetical protein